MKETSGRSGRDAAWYPDDAGSGGESTSPPDAAALLADPVERDLHNRLNAVAVAAQQALAKEAFADAAAALAVLRAPLDAFFETVTVNAADARVRGNRLNLLSRIRAELDAIADFSQIEG